AVYALRLPAAGIGGSIRARANAAHAVMLNPTAQTGSSELPEAKLVSAIPTRKEAVRSAVNACGLANLVPALNVAQEGARLIVDTHFKQVWIDGVEIKGLTPDSHPFRFIEIMARSGSA